MAPVFTEAISVLAIRRDQNRIAIIIHVVKAVPTLKTIAVKAMVTANSR